MDHFSTWILCFDQNSPWRIFIKEFIFKLLTRKLKKGLGQWHPGNLNKNFEKIMKGESFWELSTFEMSKVRNFRVTSWEFLFEFWRFIFSQSFCPIYSESTVCHHSDACPISAFKVPNIKNIRTKWLWALGNVTQIQKNLEIWLLKWKHNRAASL